MPDAQNTNRLSPRYIQAVLVQRAAAVIEEKSNLVAQLRELEELRERVRVAELDLTKRTRIRRLELGSRLRRR
jgi:hypothetical protein